MGQSCQPLSINLGMEHSDCTTTSTRQWMASQSGETLTPLLLMMVAAPRLVPNFMFGVTPELLGRMYSGPEQIPAIGIITDTTGSRAANKPLQRLRFHNHGLCSLC